MSEYRDPDVIRALAAQGYSEIAIAERAGASPDAVRLLVHGSGPRSRETASRASPSVPPPSIPESDQ